MAFLLVAWAAALAPAAGARADEPAWGPHLVQRPPRHDAVRWTDGFWAEKARLLREVSLWEIQRALQNPENAAVLANFRTAAGMREDKHLGTNWGDGDCYKWLEAVARVYGATRDDRLDRLLEDWIAVIAKAQAPDGYISMNVQLTEKTRFANPHHHEMYNMGHLLTAAAVHHRMTGKDSFLAVARGPVVYCLESPDVPDGAAVADVALPAGGDRGQSRGFREQEGPCAESEHYSS